MRRALNILSEPLPAGTVVFREITGKATTWEEFRGNVACCAAFFAARPEREFLLYTENFLRFCTWFLALLAAEKEVVLLPHVRAGALELLSDRYPVLTTDASESDGLEPSVYAGTRRIFPDPAVLPDSDFTFGPLSGRFVTFFTSGSSAEPKPIRKTFESLAAEVDFHLRGAAIFSEENSTVVASVHAHHMLGMLHRFLCPLTAGLCSDCGTIRSVEDFCTRQNAYEKIRLITTPSFLDKVVAGREFCAFRRNCASIVSSGAALSAETSAATAEIFGVLPYEIFGSTEAGGVAWRQREREADWELFPCVEAETDEIGRPRIFSPFCGNAPFQMQDSIAWTGTRRFELRGRADRLVKIAEHRVSLPEIEARFEAHSFVEQARLLLLDGVPARLGALLVLSAQGRDFLKKRTKSELTACLRAAVGRYFDPSVFPKKIRIVHKIPTNAQGKFSHVELLPFFENNLAEPVAENVRVEKDFASADLTFVSDAFYFQGHFPDFPILPGVVQIHFARIFARMFFGKDLLPKRILKLKFGGMIFPRETVSLELRRVPAGAEFIYRKGGKLCSSGTLIAEN